MRKLLTIISALLIAGPANANFDVTTGNGTHIFAIDLSNQGTSLCAAASTECPASVPVNTAGTPLFTSGNPGNVALPAFLPGQTASGTSGSNIFANGLSTEQTAVSTGQVVRIVATLDGRNIAVPYAAPELWVHGTASTTGTGATTLLAAAGSNIKNYAWVSCGRTDAGTTAAFVTLNDVEGTGSGHIIVLPNNGGGGGNNMTQPIPVVTAGNTALTFTASASISTIYCNADGFALAE